jgi:hypothetical protein
MKKPHNEIIELITAFQRSISQHLPSLEQAVQAIIVGKITRESEIENLLDTLLSLTAHGIGNELFIRLLEYYKTVSPEGAEFYWKEYDQENQE